MAFEQYFNEDLGRRIRELRRARRMKQAELADALAIPRTSVVMIEKGRQRVSAYQVVELIRVLRCPITELLAITDEPAAVRSLASLGIDSPEVRTWVEGTVGRATAIQREGGRDGEGGGQEGGRGLARSPRSRRPPTSA